MSPSQQLGVAEKLTQKALRNVRAHQNVPHPGLHFSYKHHVFITRAKGGELWALNQLSTSARARVTPLLEIVPPSPAKKERVANGKVIQKAKPQKPLPKHLEDTLLTIKGDWNTLPVLLDTKYLKTNGLPSAEALELTFGIARQLGLTAVPVTSIRFAHDFQQRVKEAVAIDHRGVVLRLEPIDFEQVIPIERYLMALQQVIQIDRGQTDIVIDLGFQKDYHAVLYLSTSLLSKMPHLNDWRTLTLASGCFPDSISDWQLDHWHPIPRIDWLSWRKTVSSSIENTIRKPSYGDYGIRCGGEPLSVPNSPYPNIRYTTPKEVLVRRGDKEDGKMKAICQSLIKRTDYSGPTFSKGDEEIAATAAKPGLPNNSSPGKWIQWCSNHHLELTASQIRKLPEP